MEHQALPPETAQHMPEMALPDGFVYLDEVIDLIDFEAKYATHDNLTGAPLRGYAGNRVAIAAAMIEPLKHAARIADGRGYALLVYDAARPQRAVDNLVEWANAPEDGLTKDRHYPNINKSDIIPQGYVARRSGHSRGAAIDLTLIDRFTREPIDMGSIFDLMDARSHHGAKGLTDAQTTNRNQLKDIMAAAGFAAYDKEWWHYRLKDEPFPDTYFDFVIEG